MKHNADPDNWYSLSIRRNRSIYVDKNCVEHKLTVFPHQIRNADSSFQKREEIGDDLKSIIIKYPKNIDVSLTGNSYDVHYKSNDKSRIVPKEASISINNMRERFQFSITVCGKLEPHQEITVDLISEDNPVGWIKAGKPPDNVDTRGMSTSLKIGEKQQNEKINL